jgi:hypothetical protein
MRFFRSRIDRYFDHFRRDGTFDSSDELPYMTIDPGDEKEAILEEASKYGKFIFVRVVRSADPSSPSFIATPKGEWLTVDEYVEAQRKGRIVSRIDRFLAQHDRDGSLRRREEVPYIIPEGRLCCEKEAIQRAAEKYGIHILVHLRAAKNPRLDLTDINSFSFVATHQGQWLAPNAWLAMNMRQVRADDLTLRPWRFSLPNIEAAPSRDKPDSGEPPSNASAQPPGRGQTS